MKKLVMALLTLALGAGLMAQENPYKPQISGELNLVAKKQDAYHSPFDIPDWGWGQRAGASNRNSQIMRAEGTLNVFMGNPGVTEWFGVASIWFDGNDPDNMKASDNNRNYDVKKVELTNAFVMWRPFEMQGGRPFGISVGQQTVKATANAAYTHIFKGDIDQDFVAYTVAGLTNKPMINLDFHVDKNTGIGYAFAQGSSDFIQNSAGFSNEYSLTHVIYGEGEYMGIGGNAAMQITMGNREETESFNTDASTAWGTDRYKKANFDYTCNALNAQLYYKLQLPNETEIMPFAGYQKLWGDEASFGKYQVTGKYGTRAPEAQSYTGGLVAKTKLFGKTISLAGEFTKVETPSFDGLAGVEDGQIDEALALAGMKVFDRAAFASGNANFLTDYTLDQGLFAGIAGGSKSTYTLLGLDYMYHAELGIDLTENFNVSFFYNAQVAKAVENLLTTTEQKNKMKDVLATKFGYFSLAEINGMVAAGQLPQSVADQLIGANAYSDYFGSDAFVNTVASTLDKANKYGTEWTDGNSMGIHFTYKF